MHIVLNAQQNTAYPFGEDEQKPLPFERAEYLVKADMYELYFEGGVVVILTPAEYDAWLAALNALQQTRPVVVEPDGVIGL